MKNHKFYFIRHGKTDWNDRSLCQGHIDIPLNSGGISEIKRVLPSLKGCQFSRIVSSPLKRALETAKIIQEVYPCSLQLSAELMERGWGSLEGCSSMEMYAIEEFEEKDPAFKPGHGVEDRQLFTMRVQQGIESALEGPTPLIVSHGRVFLIMCELLGLPLIRQVGNNQLIEYCPVRGNFKIIS